MTLYRLTLACLVLLLVPRPAGATLLDDLASPVTTPARTPLLIGTGLTVALVLLDFHIDKPVQKDLTDKRYLGKTAKWGERWGTGKLNIAYVGAQLVAGLLGSENGYRRAEVMALGSLFAVGATQVLKETIHEPRPNTAEDKQAFPSGHATAAFALASVIGAEHGPWWGVPAYGLATFIAISRINDNKHNLHDVVAGATIGMAYGLGVHYTHQGPHRLNLAVEPMLLEGGGGALLSKRF